MSEAERPGGGTADYGGAARGWEGMTGWIVGLGIIVAVLAIGAGLWLYFHH